MSEAFTITLLTPLGRGAVATISVDGPGSMAAVDRFFRPAISIRLGDAAIGRILVGHWQSLDSAIEEVVICRRAEQRIEVNCHGGQAAWQAILASLQKLGGRITEQKSWLEQRAIDSIQRAAWLALQNASTPRVAGILLDQFRGALKERIAQVVQLIDQSSIAAAVGQLEKILGFAELGFHLTQPWRVVVAGPPNVGKSSLINAMLGYERAIVYDQPGTTRDVLTAMTALDGWPIELIDTAGLRNTSDPIEAEGVSRAQAELQSADLIVLVTDHETSIDEFLDWDWTDFGERTVMVANKAELGVGTAAPKNWIRTSAVTGLGLQDLMRTLVERLVPDSPALGEAVPFTREQVEMLRSMLKSIHNGEFHQAQQLAEQATGPR